MWGAIEKSQKMNTNKQQKNYISGQKNGGKENKMNEEKKTRPPKQWHSIEYRMRNCSIH